MEDLSEAGGGCCGGFDRRLLVPEIVAGALHIRIGIWHFAPLPLRDEWSSQGWVGAEVEPREEAVNAGQAAGEKSIVDAFDHVQQLECPVTTTRVESNGEARDGVGVFVEQCGEAHAGVDQAALHAGPARRSLGERLQKVPP
jgi:hypothetical protein